MHGCSSNLNLTLLAEAAAEAEAEATAEAAAEAAAAAAAEAAAEAAAQKQAPHRTHCRCSCWTVALPAHAAYELVQYMPHHPGALADDDPTRMSSVYAVTMVVVYTAQYIDDRSTYPHVRM